MADDSEEIHKTLKFHPCDTPRGCLYYNPSLLTRRQQKELNKFKVNYVREHHKYLARNPEIHAIISLILNYVLDRKPRRNLHRTIGEYFKQADEELSSQIAQYIEDHGLVRAEEEKPPHEVIPEEEEESMGDIYKIIRKYMWPHAGEDISSITTSKRYTTYSEYGEGSRYKKVSIQDLRSETSSMDFLRFGGIHYDILLGESPPYPQEDKSAEVLAFFNDIRESKDIPDLHRFKSKTVQMSVSVEQEEQEEQEEEELPVINYDDMLKEPQEQDEVEEEEVKKARRARRAVAFSDSAEKATEQEDVEEEDVEEMAYGSDNAATEQGGDEGKTEDSDVKPIEEESKPVEKEGDAQDE